MERLISSPSSIQTLPKSKLFLSKPKIFIAPLVPISAPKRQFPSHLRRCCLSLSNLPLHYPAKEKKRSEENPIPSFPQLSQGRKLAVPLLRKVVSAAIPILLSASIPAIIHSLLPQRAYATVQAASTTSPLIRPELLSSAWTGFLAGCLHTLSGPDHLAALAPLSIGCTKIESAAVGALWGCGHDAGQLNFCLAFLLLKDQLHIEIIRTWGTRVVALTLLAIGAAGIREASEVPAPCVALENGSMSVVGPLEAVSRGNKKIGFATFATGVVHGLQPDALLMVLPALALPSRLSGAAFLGMFLVGTVLAMGSYTAFIGSCSQALKDRIPRITEKLTWAASLVAISMGVAIFVSQFFGFSLY